MCYYLTLGHFLYWFAFVFEPYHSLQMTLNSDTSVKASKTKLERISHFTVNIVTTDCCFLWMEIQPSPNNNAEQLPSISIMKRVLGLLRSGKTGCRRFTSRIYHRNLWRYDSQMLFSDFCTHRLHTCPCIYISIFIYTIQIIYIHTYVIYPHIYNNLLKKRN